MFKKSSESSQFNIFTSPKTLFSGNSLKMYEDECAWHNQFRKQVTIRIDENIFRPLYCEDNGTPNAPVRVLVAMMILKEAEGLSDQKIFKNCRFNLLFSSTLVSHNADSPLPTESTYFLFRKRILEYAKEKGENLFETVFAQITKGQCAEFEVSGKRIRMDGKLLGSNIAWLSRYELIHETLRLFYKQVKQSGKLDKDTEDRLDDLLKLKGDKVVYTCSDEEVKSRLQEFGVLIYKILPLFSSSSGVHYQTLQRVFGEQYRVDDKKMVVAREKEEISAKSVHSPHDTDCHYRNKDDQKMKGYSINIAESCDENKPLNLIGHVDVRKASTSDTCFLRDGIEKAQEVFPDKTEAAHADGAYHSLDNQKFCKDNEINLYLHAIQGASGRCRGEIKHQMWANIRCLWVNFVRILKYIKQLCQRTLFSAKYSVKLLFTELYFAIKSFLSAILPNNLSESENTRLSFS